MATYTDNYNLVKPTMAETADIRTINGNMDSVDNIMHATQVSLAPAYDSSETYNTGDIVMYEFLMYECIDDDVTGTWDATKWQRTTAGEHGGGGGGSDVEITPTLQSGTKIADFEIDGVSGALYAPNGGGGGSSEIYDDTERVVGTWFGKTLYKVSKMGTFSSGTLTALTLSDNIDTLVSYEASIFYPPNNQWLRIPYAESGDYIYLITTDNLVKMISSSGMSAYTKFALTIKYTKSST